MQRQWNEYVHNILTLIFRMSMRLGCTGNQILNICVCVTSPVRQGELPKPHERQEIGNSAGSSVSSAAAAVPTLSHEDHAKRAHEEALKQHHASVAASQASASSSASSSGGDGSGTSTSTSKSTECSNGVCTTTEVTEECTAGSCTKTTKTYQSESKEL